MLENDVILKLLNSNFKIEFCNLELIREGGNKTYSVYTTNNKYFLKVVNFAFADTIKTSVDINLFLQQNGFSVPKIILATNNRLITEIEVENRTYFLILYEFLEMSEIDIEKDAEEVGDTIAKLHNIMNRYSGILVRQDKRFFIDRYIEIMKKKKYTNVNEFALYGDELWQRVDSLARGYCHGDMYTGNIMRSTDGKLYILDFDTSCIGFPIYDLALVCNQTHYFDYDENGIYNTAKIFTKLYAEYICNNLLPKTNFTSICDMLALYHFALQATIIEIHGLDCVDNAFFDKQLDWLQRWRKQSKLIEFQSK